VAVAELVPNALVQVKVCVSPPFATTFTGIVPAGSVGDANPAGIATEPVPLQLTAPTVFQERETGVLPDPP
jgi:hypothetical protein